MKISFLKRSQGTNGEDYEATILSIDLLDSLPETAAVVRAVKQFEEYAGVSHWQQAADRYTIT